MVERLERISKTFSEWKMNEKKKEVDCKKISEMVERRRITKPT